MVAGLDDHPGDPRVQGQPGHEPAVRGEMTLPIQGAKLGEQGITVLDGPARRRVEKGELGRIDQLETGHPQDNLGQVGSQYLGRRIFGPVGVILLTIEADADPWPHPAAAALALVAARPRNRDNGQLAGPGPDVVARQARQAGINHIADAGHGDGGFSHIGGDDDLPALYRLKDLFLVAGRQPAVQGQHHGHRSAGPFAQPGL